MKLRERLPGTYVVGATQLMMRASLPFKRKVTVQGGGTKAKRLTWLCLAVPIVCLGAPVWGEDPEFLINPIELTAQLSPPVEGSAGVWLGVGGGDAKYLVNIGGCTADSMTHQVSVLDADPEPFTFRAWDTADTPGVGPVCEHVIAGDGEVAYLIGGYSGDWSTRPMFEGFKVELVEGPPDPVVEFEILNISCSGDCPEPVVGASSFWLDSIDGCEGGGVAVAGGMNAELEATADVNFLCVDTLRWIPQPNLDFPMADQVIVKDEGIGGGVWKIAYDWAAGGTSMEVSRRNPLNGDWFPIPVDGVKPPASWGGSGFVRDDGEKIVLVIGANAFDASISDEIWEFDVASSRWDRKEPESTEWRPIVNFDLEEIPQDGSKSGGVAHVLIFGGVEDFHAPRTLSDSTYLMTITTPEPPAHYAVPAVARVQGAGAFFTSVMHLYAAGTADLELEMTFTPREGSGGSVTTVNHTVPAGVMQTIEDPLETLFGFSGGSGRVGSVLITVTSGSAADLMAQTVVFAELDSGEEYGQFFPAMPIGDAISSGQTAYLNTTEDPSHNRVNIGLMAVADDTRFRVRPVDPLGSGLAAPMTFDLDTGGNTQINNLHSTFGLGTMADVVVEVEVLAGSGFSYASVLDGSGAYSGTSDPTTILPSLAGAGKVTLLEIGSIQGLNEFSGSASITNYSNRSATVRADFFQRGESGVRTTENLTIAAGDTVGYTDLGADLFGVSGDVGSVVLTSTNNTRIGATGREFAIFRGGQNQVIGTAGQLIAGQTDNDRLAAGSTHHFIGLRQERGSGAVERSHFAVYNPAWGDAEVTVRLYDGASGTLEGERSWTVERRTLIQVNNVIRAINSGYDGNEKRIEVEVDKPVFMNAFRVNRWGDPVTLSPF